MFDVLIHHHNKYWIYSVNQKYDMMQEGCVACVSALTVSQKYFLRCRTQSKSLLEYLEFVRL